jgi:hypothetical protein
MCVMVNQMVRWTLQVGLDKTDGGVFWGIESWERWRVTTRIAIKDTLDGAILELQWDLMEDLRSGPLMALPGFQQARRNEERAAASPARKARDVPRAITLLKRMIVDLIKEQMAASDDPSFVPLISSERTIPFYFLVLGINEKMTSRRPHTGITDEAMLAFLLDISADLTDEQRGAVPYLDAIKAGLAGSAEHIDETLKLVMEQLQEFCESNRIITQIYKIAPSTDAVQSNPMSGHATSSSGGGAAAAASSSAFGTKRPSPFASAAAAAATAAGSKRGAASASSQKKKRPKTNSLEIDDAEDARLEAESLQKAIRDSTPFEPNFDEDEQAGPGGLLGGDSVESKVA